MTPIIFLSYILLKGKESNYIKSKGKQNINKGHNYTYNITEKLDNIQSEAKYTKFLHSNRNKQLLDNENK